MKHLSLFSGIGGLDLAAEWAGIETVGQCEWADYPHKILCKHWPKVEKWRDIKELSKETFYERTGLQTVDIISGGFPCQPFSIAGKRKGKSDDRYLWPEMLRVIKELWPNWVVGENVTGIVNMELDTALSDLESENYTARAFIIPACGVDAAHRRYRVAIVAHSNGAGCEKFSLADFTNNKGFNTRSSTTKNVSNSNGGRCSWKQWREYAQQPENGSRWTVEPGMDRVANGIPNRVDRIRSLGNAVVPQQFYPIFKAIVEIEAMKKG